MEEGALLSQEGRRGQGRACRCGCWCGWMSALLVRACGQLLVPPSPPASTLQAACTVLAVLHWVGR